MNVLVNLLTLSRLLGAAIALAISILFNELHVALIILVVSGATDLLDGYLARKFYVESEFGMYLDGYCDIALWFVSGFIAFLAAPFVALIFITGAIIASFPLAWFAKEIWQLKALLICPGLFTAWFITLVF